MAGKGEVIISAGLSTVELEKQVDRVVKSIDNSAKQLGTAISDMTTRLEKSFGGLGKASKSATEEMAQGAEKVKKSNDDIANSFLGVSKAMRDLENQRASGKVNQEEYIRQYRELQAVLATVARQADETGKKLAVKSPLTVKDTRAVRGGTITEERMQSLNIPQLQQALNITQNRIQLGEKDLSQQQKLIDLQARLNNLLKEAKRTSEQKAKPTFDSAMGLSERSITERITKIKQLEQVQKNLSTSEQGYEAKLRQTNQAMERLKKANQEAVNSGIQVEKQTNKLATAFENLGSRVLFYASLGALKSFLGDVAQIRAEYEVTERSIGAIIGDMQKGQEIFAKQQQAALKSPFTVIDLASATKQLSAYGVAVDELVPLSKRIADIASGLGTDMSRIIYNTGQIAAKGIADMRDIRDYGNSGLNVLGGLSDMYSKLEGRTVSYGEVIDRVSNRMVSYGDIIKVINKFTDEGGMFFEMQAKQAETLRGQLSNLTDAYNNMLNEIGKGNQGLISGTIGILRTLTENWRILETTLYSVIAAFGAYRAGVILTNIVTNGFNKASILSALNLSNLGTYLKISAAAMRSQALATRVAESANKDLNKSMLALAKNPYALIAAAVALLAVAIYNAYQNSQQLNRELTKITNEGAASADAITSKYKELSDRLQTVVRYSKEHRDIIEELNSKYGEYLPFLIDETTELRKIAGAYDQVAEAVKRSEAAKALQTGKQKIEEEYEVQKQTEKLQKSLEKNFDPKTSATIIKKYTAELNRQFKEGEEMLSDISFIKVYRDYVGKDAKKLTEGYVLDAAMKFRRALKDTYDETEKLNLRIKGAFGTDFNSLAAQQRFDAIVEAEKQAQTILLKSYEGDLENQKLTNEQKELLNIDYHRKRIALEEDFAVKKAKLQAEDQKKSEQWLNNEIANIKTLGDVTLENVNQRIANSPLNEILKSLISITKEAAKGGLLKVSEDAIANYKTWADQVDRLNKLKIKETKIDEESLRLAEQKKAAYLFLIKLLGLEDQIQDKIQDKKNQPQGSKKDAQLEAIKKEISLIDKLRKEYEDLTNAGMASGDATSFLSGNYEDLIKNLNKDLGRLGLPLFKMADIAGKSDAEISKYLENVKKKLSSRDAIDAVDIEIAKVNVNAKKTEFTDISKAISDALDKTKLQFELGMELESAPKGLDAVLMEILGINEQDVIRDLDGAIKRVNDGVQQAIDKYNATSDTKISTIDFAQSGMSEEYIKSLGIKDNDLQKQLQAALKLVQDWRSKEAKDTSKAYEELLKKYADFEYQKQEIQKQAQKEREDLNKNFFSDELKQTQEYKKLSGAIDTKEKQETAKVELEEFKSTDLYQDVFEDFSRVSIDALSLLKTKMEEIKEGAAKNLSPTDFKTFMTEYNKVRDELEAYTPFQTITTGLEEFRDATREVIVAQEELNKLQKGSPEYEEAQKKLTEAQKKQALAAGKVENGFKSLKDKTDNVAKAFNAVIELTNSITDAFGIAEDSDFAIFMKDVGTALGIVAGALTLVSVGVKIYTETVTEATAASATFMTVAAPLLAIAAAVGAIAAIIYAANKKNRDIDKKVEKSEKAVKNLEQAYKGLERTVEKAMGSQEIAAKKALEANLRLQKAEIDRQLALEQSRKGSKKDEEKIDELTAKSQELAWAIEDAADDIVNGLLGTNVKDAAEEFSNIWIDAFLAGEDAMESLNKKFGQMIQNMIVKAISGKIIAKRLEPLWKELDNMLSDNVITEAEALSFMNNAKLLGEMLNSDMKALQPLWDALKTFFRESGVDSNLQGLQKGIQGVTEQTAGVIEGYMNSVRTEVLVHTSLFHQMIGQNDMMIGLNGQMLLQAQQSYQTLQAIRLWTESITSAGHTKGGSAIKVFMD